MRMRRAPRFLQAERSGAIRASIHVPLATVFRVPDRLMLVEISQCDAVEVRFSLDEWRNYGDLCAIRKLSHKPTNSDKLVSESSRDRKQVLGLSHTAVVGMR